MFSWSSAIFDPLWRTAIGVVPLALMVAVICRYLPHRPGARHALWCVVLLALGVLPLLPGLASERAAVSPAGYASSSPVVDMDLPLRPAPVAPPVESAIFQQSSAAEPICSADAGGPLGEDVATEVEPISVDGTGAVLAENHDVPPIDLRRLLTHVLRATGAASNGLAEAAPDRSAEAAELPLGETASPEVTFAVPAAAPPGDAPLARLPESAEPPLGGILRRWRVWGDEIAAVRDALGHVSPIPASLWLGGAVLMGLFQATGALILRRRLRAGYPAPADVRRAVAVAARRLGLRSVPPCRMVRGRVSPMIWCGWRRRLILPGELWAELDEAGRHAVITHELAHLRRRDHWVRWLDLALGCIYWWHPLVWWVRSRVQSEAEICCDAWVTWVMPRERRAYAGALLAAHTFVSAELGAVPAVGIGAGGRNAKTIARRLTMIMTRKDAPGFSTTGWILAGALIFTGWAATPARSQPAPAPAVVVTHEAPGEAPIVLSADGIVVAAADGSGGVTRITAVPAEAPAPARANEPVEARMDRLERQLAELTALLQAQRAGSAATVPAAPVLPRTPRMGRARVQAPGQPALPAPPTPPLSAAPGAPAPLARMAGETIEREYELEAGKLDALLELMSRDDVPIVVMRRGDKIGVRATAAQHEVLSRFVGLIGNPVHRTYTVPAGKLEAFVKLMIREDVPIHISPGHGEVEVHGTPAQQRIVEDFLKIINGLPVAQAGGCSEDALSLYRALGAGQEKWRSEGLMRAQAHAEQWRARASELDALRAHGRAFAGQRQTMQAEAERFREEAQRLREEYERLREQFDRAREQWEREVEERSQANDAAVDAQAEAFEAEWEAMLASYEAQLEHAESLEAAADAMEEAADEMAEQAEQAESIEPAAAVELEAH